MADLTARQVETTTKVGYTADRKQRGLNLQVTASASGYARSWVFRYTSPITQKPREIGLVIADIHDWGKAKAGPLANRYIAMFPVCTETA